MSTSTSSSSFAPPKKLRMVTYNILTPSYSTPKSLPVCIFQFLFFLSLLCRFALWLEINVGGRPEC
jgi:hypothetical protein